MFSFTHCGNGGGLYGNYTKKASILDWEGFPIREKTSQMRNFKYNERKRIKRQLLLDLNYLV